MSWKPMPVTNTAWPALDTALDATPLSVPLSARAPARKPLDVSMITQPPLTARGPRQAESQFARQMGQSQADRCAYEWKSHTDAVLQRALQTLEAMKKTSEMDGAIDPPSRTPRFPPPVCTVPSASPRMRCRDARAQPMASPRMLSATQTSNYKMPESSPMRAAVARTPTAQRPAPSPMTHSAPNVGRQAPAFAVAQSTNADYVFSNSHSQLTSMYARSVSRQMAPPHTTSAAAPSYRPWAFGHPM